MIMTQINTNGFPLDAVLIATQTRPAPKRRGVPTRGIGRRRKRSVPCWDAKSLLDAVLAQTIKNLIATQPVEEAA
jgi:hypothetical protein